MKIRVGKYQLILRSVLFPFLVGWMTPARADEPSPNLTSPPPAEQFVIVPLRVHVLTSDLPEIDCKLSDADVRRILGKVNRVWAVAGVHFGLESIVRDPAADQDRFVRVREQLGGAPLGLFRTLRPEASRAFDGLHVYYVHNLPVNGVWMNEDFAIVRETAKLGEVEGGIDEPVPRVTSHELGHALGLPHRQDRTNLMASGTTGTLLNEAEVKVVREKALKVNGAVRYDDCRQRGKTDERMKRWADEVEGEGITDEQLPPQASSALTICGSFVGPISRWLRPWYMYPNLNGSRPSRWSTVAWRSWTGTLSFATK